MRPFVRWDDLRRFAAASGLAGLAALPRVASGQSRTETLRYVTGANVNTLDPTIPGSTHESFGLSMNVHDRLFTFGRKKVGANRVFDPTTIWGELAQGYQISPRRIEDHHQSAPRRVMARRFAGHCRGYQMVA
jgi:peptide/nickel transport system substrate-binding protein